MGIKEIIFAMRNFLLSTLLLLSFHAYSADTVRVYNAASFAVNAISGVSYALNVDSISGDATAEAAPATIYLPMKNTSVANYNQYFFYSRSGGVVLDSTTNNSATMAVKFPLLINVGATAKYIYSAVKVNSAYYVVSKSTSNYTNQTNLNLEFSISPSQFCATYPLGGVTNPCSDTSNFTTSMTTYFFVSSASYANGGVVDVATTETGGVYFALKLSNIINTSAQLTVAVTNVRNGDRRVILDYAGSTTMNNFLKLKAFVHSTLPPSENFPLGDTLNYLGSIMSKDLSTTQVGEVTINELVNNLRYDLSLFFVDKYYFTSTLSPHVTAEPLEIQELLKKQACFLLTAGFGEEHYVINFFRNYRDQVLGHSWLGKKFIKVYYRSAPHYAEIIYKSETMRLVIRAMAYILYFLFNYYWLILLFLVSCYFLDIRKIKMISQRNSL